MTSGMIEFRKMSKEEFSHVMPPLIEAYAKDIARNFKRPMREVRIEARKQTKQLLKDGMLTRDHHFFNVIQKKSGKAIGHVWFSFQKRKRRAFLYDILVHRAQRGRGYGRETMRVLESKLREYGISQLGLHVFAHNQVAIKLYKSQGYFTASYNMQKQL